LRSGQSEGRNVHEMSKDLACQYSDSLVLVATSN
jgi:hypothetical protein